MRRKRKNRKIKESTREKKDKGRIIKWKKEHKSEKVGERQK